MAEKAFPEEQSKERIERALRAGVRKMTCVYQKTWFLYRELPTTRRKGLGSYSADSSLDPVTL